MCQGSSRVTQITVINVLGDGLLGILYASLPTSHRDSIFQNFIFYFLLHLSKSQAGSSYTHYCNLISSRSSLLFPLCSVSFNKYLINVNDRVSVHVSNEILEELQSSTLQLGHLCLQFLIYALWEKKKYLFLFEDLFSFFTCYFEYQIQYIARWHR